MVLIAPPQSYRITPYLNAIRQMGASALLVSSGKYSLVSELAQGIHVDFADALVVDTIIHHLADTPPQAVLGTDEISVEIAAKVAAAFGLAYNNPRGTLLARRKDLARLCLKDAGLPVPDFFVGDLTALLSSCPCPVAFPLVVKPLALSGSRGVIRANNLDELHHALLRIDAILRQEYPQDAFERQQVLLEAFIPGPEVAVEALLNRGKLQILAVFDKPDPLNGPYFEETYYVAPSRLSAVLLERVETRLTECCVAYGLSEGPVHAEFRLHDQDAWLLELAARTIGGECARLVELYTGSSLETLVVQNALGMRMEANRSAHSVGVLMIPIPQAGLLRRVEGVLEASQILYIEHLEISIHAGYELVPLPEGNSYLGFIFARAPSPELTEQALRHAHGCLTIVTTPLLAVG